MLEIKKISTDSPEYENIKAKQFFNDAELSAAINNICCGDNIQLYIAEKDGEVRGFAVANHATPDVISLLALSVAPEHRGSGIATAMLNYILADTNPKAVVAEALDDSIGFFTKYGFYLNDLGEKPPGKHAYYATYRPVK